MSEQVVIKKKEFDEKPEDETRFDKKKNVAIQVSLIGIMAAMGIGGSYALSFLPNVEILITTIFITSFLFGIPIGCAIATVSSLIYHSFNPWGVAPLPTLIILTLLYVVIAIIGGLTKILYKKYSKIDFEYSKWTIYRFAVIGVSLTLFFDFIGALTIFFYTGQAIDLSVLITTYIMQVPFTLIHVACNLCLFAFVAPIVIQRTYNFMMENEIT
ncbi:MAG: hypothetical protein EAX96_18250 [Candidatus Lokiarchaeota archaeon]|nr:hypothetical protein [Candidatus Lokiarchaeota archaeon]